MGWASGHIVKLRVGETVSFRPRGNSMSGKIESGQLCTVEPVDASLIRVGDVVLCKVNGREYLHLVKAIQGAALLVLLGTPPGRPISVSPFKLDPEAQGRGVGKALLADINGQLDLMGANRITLNTQRSNVISQRLYRSSGFKIVGPPLRVYHRPLA